MGGEGVEGAATRSGATLKDAMVYQRSVLERQQELAGGLDDLVRAARAKAKDKPSGADLVRDACTASVSPLITLFTASTGTLWHGPLSGGPGGNGQRTRNFPSACLGDFEPEPHGLTVPRRRRSR